MASKPMDPTMPPDSGTGTPDALGPSAAWTPASPARAPASTMVMIVVRATLIPAVAAACGLAPTARIAKPTVDRSRIHQTATAASRARKNPRWSWLPSSLGMVAVQSTIGEMGSVRPGRWKATVVSR